MARAEKRSDMNPVYLILHRAVYALTVTSVRRVQENLAWEKLKKMAWKEKLHLCV